MAFGKHFDSMYRGSMVGSGFAVFAVMGYVIANQKPDRDVGWCVELHPALLVPVFGESEEKIAKAIEYLCAPDPKTTTPGDDGRRLVKIAGYEYRVVNGEHYHAIRDEQERRRQNREAQARRREKLKGKKKEKHYGPSMAERLATSEKTSPEDKARLQEIQDGVVPGTYAAKAAGERAEYLPQEGETN